MKGLFKGVQIRQTVALRKMWNLENRAMSGNDLAELRSLKQEMRRPRTKLQNPQKFWGMGAPDTSRRGVVGVWS